MTVIRTTRTLLVGAAVAVAAAGLAVSLPANAAAPQHAHHAPKAKTAPVTTGSRYLALGDSVSFGYREAANRPTPDYAKASTFVGYPEIVARELGLRLANAACPGETSASLNHAKARSNGCETSSSGTGPGYRTAYPLHVKYRGTQQAYAVQYLRKHPNTRLVSLMIGANDAFLCEEHTKDGCQSAAELGAVVKRIEKNVGITMRAIRNKAHYSGQVVIVNYYSTDYTNTLQTLASQVINNAQDTAAKPYHVRIANGFAAFKAAAKQAGGNTCTAGLLTTLSTGGCGVHPSVAGQSLLAGTVIQKIKK